MADFDQLFVLDEGKDVDGVWFEDDDGLMLKIACAGNAAYQKKLQKLLIPFRSRTGNLRKQQEVILRKALVGTVLKDWKNLKRKGEDIPYSDEAADEFLTHRMFMEKVMGCASDMSAFKVETDEDISKN